MIALQIDNPVIETIFLEKFGSNKESFFQFIADAYEKKQLLQSLDAACKQAKLQHNGELSESSLNDLIDELRHHPHA